MTVREQIRATHAQTTPRRQEDPLRAFLSEVVLRDHARLVRLVLRRLHAGEKRRDGDLWRNGEGTLEVLRLRWWQRAGRIQPNSPEHYRPV